MTDATEKIAARRELEKRATPGPWWRGANQSQSALNRVQSHRGRLTGSITEEDADLIVATRNDYAALLDNTEVLARFVRDFETDFVLGGLIVDGPGERWGPLVPLYEAAKAALRAWEDADDE